MTQDKDGNKGQLVEKYDSCTDDQLKTLILCSFIIPNGVVRILVATCAFIIYIGYVPMYIKYFIGACLVP